MSTLQERIAEIMEATGWSVGEISRVTDVSSSAVTQWKDGPTKSLKAGPANKLAAASGFAAMWIATGQGPKHTQPLGHQSGSHTKQHVNSQPDTLQAHDSFVIPQFETGGRMGNGGVILREQPGVIQSWLVSTEWLQKNVHRITSPSNLVIATGFGDSMRPLFNPGDPLLIDTGRKRVDVDGIYFFRIGEEGYIKRLQRIPTAAGTILRAKSENPAYDPFDIQPGMDFEVFGWVVKVWRGEDF